MAEAEIAVAFQPHQIEHLQKAVKSVVEEPWFLRSFENETELAKIVGKSYQDGMTNEFILFRYIRTIARQRFCTENADSRWPLW